MRPKFTLDGITEGKRNAKAYKKTEMPGPGQYNPLDNTHGPKYTIGLKRDSNNKKDIKGKGVPGVGTYNLVSDEDFKVPCYIISKEKRKNLNLNHSALNYPAPNKYVYDLDGSSSKAPRWTFSKSERFPKPKNKPKSAMARSTSLPGPGSYQTQFFIGHDGPQYTFSKEKFSHADAVDIAMEKKTMNYPSPTTYHTSIRYISNTPMITMSKLKRPDLNNDKYSKNFPGPAHYKPNKYKSSVMKQFPVWSVYKSERDESNNENVKKKKRIITPGPGHYNIKNGQIPCGPHFSMAHKLVKNKSMLIPGPGNYNIAQIQFHSEPKWTIGKAKRSENNKEVIKEGFPGPGRYNVKDNLFPKGIHFTKDKRVKESKFVTPGPGKYKIPTAFDYINDYTRSKGIFDPTFKYV